MWVTKHQNPLEAHSFSRSEGRVFEPLNHDYHHSHQRTYFFGLSTLINWYYSPVRATIIVRRGSLGVNISEEAPGIVPGNNLNRPIYPWFNPCILKQIRGLLDIEFFSLFFSSRWPIQTLSSWRRISLTTFGCLQVGKVIIWILFYQQWLHFRYKFNVLSN